MVLDAQGGVGAEAVACGSLGDQRAFGGGRARADRHVDVGVSRERLRGPEGQPAAFESVFDQLLPLSSWL